jgi:CRISPR/Cas system-associated protein Cas10 (large subunit of type III CRISPR-Cas system)
MLEVANEKEFGAEEVFANGGSALFLIKGDEEVAKRFGTRVRQKYYEKTGGGAALTFATQGIPEHVKDVWNDNVRDTLDLLYYRLEETSHSLSDPMVLPSHPLLRPCSACGTNYAEDRDGGEERDPAVSDNRYCSVCSKKRAEDEAVKKGIKRILREREKIEDDAEDETAHISYA